MHVYPGEWNPRLWGIAEAHDPVYLTAANLGHPGVADGKDAVHEGAMASMLSKRTYCIRITCALLLRMPPGPIRSTDGMCEAHTILVFGVCCTLATFSTSVNLALPVKLPDERVVGRGVEEHGCAYMRNAMYTRRVAVIVFPGLKPKQWAYQLLFDVPAPVRVSKREHPK
eukprot:1180426-Prorocentrum_minimum.AAC.1